MSINSGMVSVRVHARNERFKKAVEDTLNELTQFPDQPRRVSTKLANFILIQHRTLISGGVTYLTQVRNIGAGVKELYLTELFTKEP